MVRTAMTLLIYSFMIISCTKRVSPVADNKKEPGQTNVYELDSSGLWKELAMPSVDTGNATIKPDKFRFLQLDFSGMKRLLAAAPKEKDAGTMKGILVNIPMPEGNYLVFRIYETEVMAPELAAKFPDIKSFGGNGMADPTMTIRLDHSPNGFRALILTEKGGINIDPYYRGDVSKYICYYKQDFNPGNKQRMPVDSLK